jgi:hypothetical protein
MYIKGKYIKPSIIISYVTPVITKSLVGGTISINSSFTFSIQVAGSPPLRYSWYKNNVLISNQNNSTFTINNASINDDAYYYCKVSNDKYTVNSEPVKLTVLYPVGITTQPNTLYVNPNQTDFFTVSVSGSDPIIYNWYKDNILITSSSINTLYIIDANEGDVADYYCVIYNLVKSVTSNTVRAEITKVLSIISTPSNIAINLSKTLNVNLICTGTPPITAQWRKNNINYKSPVILKTGGTVPLLISNIQLSDEGVYDCVLTNINGTISSNTFNVYLNKAASFTLQPIASTVDVGSNYTFSVNASGSEPITYEWYKNNPITYLNVTTKSLTLNDIEPNNESNYFCVATNIVNSVTSNVVLLSTNSNYLITRNNDYILLDTNTYWNLS